MWIKEVINSEVNVSSKALAFFLIMLEVQRALPPKIKQKDPVRPLRCFLTNSLNPPPFFVSSSWDDLFYLINKFKSLEKVADRMTM